MSNPTSNNPPSTGNCPAGWAWCTLDHESEGHNDYHSGSLTDFDKSEADGGLYYAYLLANTGDPAMVAVDGPGGWHLELSTTDAEHMLEALRDGCELATKTLAALLSVSSAPKALPWWKTAENPPCPDWCTDQHPADEIRSDGEISHHAIVAAGALTKLTRVSWVVAGDNPGDYVLESDEVQISVDSPELVVGNAECGDAVLRDLLPVAQEIIDLAKRVAS